MGIAGDDVRINDRFFKGGESFRGFDVAGIGPRQLVTQVDRTDPLNPVTTTLVGNSLGGNAYAIGTAQLGIPLGLPKEFNLSGALFTDFGTVGILDDKFRQPGAPVTPVATPNLTYTSFINDDLALRASAGISIFWESPFGPVQFDIADPFLKQSYDKTQNFRFSTRTKF
jgi:outer membrane protein insertion porin family